MFNAQFGKDQISQHNLTALSMQVPHRDLALFNSLSIKYKTTVSEARIKDIEILFINKERAELCSETTINLCVEPYD